MTKMEKKFRRPEPEYRSAPFWSWNDDLDDKALQYQLDEMKKGGMAGGFIHSRVGLITPYLSKAWMKCVRNTVKYAKRIGIPIYLYDEDRWPSGFAGGLVTKNKKYAMKILKITRLTSKKASKSGSWRFETLTTPSSAYFNNAGYLDTLNQKAVREFIKSTYTAYQKVVGDEFNKTIPAIFTDEPNYLMGWGLSEKYISYLLPWTKGLDKIFRQNYGYDLKENFIYLIENKGDYKKVRYQFIKLVTELFVENFGREIHDWCEENNIALTGHYLAEDTLTSQIAVLGAAMPLYEYMQMPGVDHLARQVDSAYLTIKQCSSVAHQLDKERVLSELFGCSGQNMTFTDRKWIGNWNTVLGINLFCPHLWLYSMAGERKRDYPPTISYQQPYWKYNKVIEDYFARINFIANRGRFQADVLVLHPIESAWCLYNPANTRPVDRLNSKFVRLLKTLSGQHYDYDLGDESLISRYGRVRAGSSSGRITRTQPLFEVGRMGYRLVIIPPVITLRKTTIELLNSFIDKGGRVIGFKPVPQRIDGRKDEKGLIRQLYSRIKLLSEPGTAASKKETGPGYKKTLLPAVTAVVERDISIAEVNKDVEIEDIYYQHRMLNGHTDIYFLVNNNKEKGYSARIKIPARTKTVLEIWDPVTGGISVLDKVRRKDGYFNCCLYFPEASSYILVSRERSVSRKSAESSSQQLLYNQLNCAIGLKHNLTLASCVPGKEIIELPASNWVCRQKGLNSLTLDYCRYKTPGMKTWSRPRYVLDVQNILEKRLKNNTPFSIKYSFKTKLDRHKCDRREEGSKREIFRVFFVLERPEQYEIKVNDRKIAYKDIGYWLDIAFKKIDITDYIRLRGRNTIELKSRFTHPRKPKTLIYVKGGTEIESVYLTGNFNVEGRFRPKKEGLIGRGFTIVDGKDPNASDTIRSGYPFYAGEFVFSQEFEFPADIPRGKRIFLSLDKLDAITLRVTLNKKEAGLVLWPPHALDITDFLKKGKNLIEIEITNSLRNLLGPHHQRDINPKSVGPGSFDDKKNWIDGYTFMPFGLDNPMGKYAEPN